MIVAEINKMSVEEKLLAIEELWESLRHDAANRPSPDWHEAILSERQREMDSAEAEYLTIQELRQRYR